MGTIVEKAKQSLLARVYAYEWYESYPYGRYRGRRQLASSLPSAVCVYLTNLLEEIGRNGRLDLSQESKNIELLRT